ncbi:MAG: hypothetical protein QM817_03140 [Archangium sp.]
MSDLSRRFGVPAINLRSAAVEEAAVRLVPRDVAEKHCILPIRLMGESLVIVMADPTNAHAVDDLKFVTGMNVEAVVAPAADIRSAIARVYPR